MNEERRMILQMLKDGSVSVEEAERLLEAVPADDQETSLSNDVYTGASPKRISILVTSDGKTKVNVKIPFSLVKVGLKLGQSFGVLGAKRGNMSEEEIAALEMIKDIDIDEIINSIKDGEITLPYVLVDVDEVDKGEHVRIMIE